MKKSVVGSVSLLWLCAPLLSSAQSMPEDYPGLTPAKQAALQRRLASGEARPRFKHNGGAPPHSEPQALPHWTGSFTTDGANRAGSKQTYPYTMVGTDPSHGSATTTIRTILVPLRVEFPIAVFDPTTDIVQPLNRSVIDNILNSPVFKPAPIYSGPTNVGNTQYADAVQRGNFWNIVSRHAPDYHVLLKPEVYATQTLVVPDGSGGLYPDQNGVLYGNLTYDYLQTAITGVLAQIHDPAALVIFVTHNVVGCDLGCLGYHDALTLASGQQQTYIFTSYLNSLFSGLNGSDISVISHEISEWMSDPFVDNLTPNWSPVGWPSPSCAFSGSLEVGDPVELSPQWLLSLPAFGVTWHPQDIVFLPWFQGAASSTSVNGWYTFGNLTPVPHEPCAGLEGYTFTSLDYPGATATRAFGVNGKRTIVGNYTAGGLTRGFVYDKGQFTTLAVPGATSTTAYAINDSGQVVGTFRSLTGLHAFSYDKGAFRAIDIPGATFIQATGVNNQGVIAGMYADAAGILHSFLLKGDHFTFFDPPSVFESGAFGINNTGTIVGAYDTGNADDNFGYIGSPGDFAPFGFPGFGNETLPWGLNNRGDVVGFFYDFWVGLPRGFARIGNTYQNLVAPGAFQTAVYGISDSGTIVGWYQNYRGRHAIVLDPPGK